MIDQAQGVQQILNGFAEASIDVPSAISDAIVPTDYSNIPNTGEGNIGDLMGHLASYIHYLEYKVGLAEADHDIYNSYYELERKKILLTLPSERRDIMEAKVEIQLEEISKLVVLKYAQMKLLKTLLDGKKRIFDSLSRELSRRSLVLQMQRGGL